MREISCEDGIAELHKINTDLVELLVHVTKFVDWWSNITGKLVTIRDNTHQLGSSKVDMSNRLDLTQKRWVDVKNQYRTYVHEVSPLAEQPIGQCFFTEFLL